MDRNEFLKEILFQLSRGEKHYEEYCKGQTYNYALALWRTNLEICRAINESIGLLDLSEQEIFLKWMLHLDVWQNQFEDLKETLQPSLSTKFVFERIEGSLPVPHSLKAHILKLISKQG